jgi:hypothetical protein
MIMDTQYFRAEKNKPYPGFAGLFLVLILGTAMMFLLFVLYTGALNPFAPFQGTEADRYCDPNAYPWEEGHLFINQMLDGYDMGGRRPPFRAQPKLESKLRYAAEVYDNQQPLGEIKLTISKNGDATAAWDGDFRIGAELYEVVAGKKDGDEVNVFRGNTAPLKIYEDENGPNRSKLYVITEGLFHLQRPNSNETLTGPAYVTAWIDKDYQAEGKLATPGFIDGEPAIFNWGPVKPSEQ